jgi:hypothetical protein
MTILRTALGNGEHALTFVQLTARFMECRESQVTDDDIEGMRAYLKDARRGLQIEDDPLVTILVTSDYFTIYHANNRMPHDFDAAKGCCALHRRRAVGIRIATLRGHKDDPIFLAWIALNDRTADGIHSANNQRMLIEFQKRALSLPRVQKALGKARLEEFKKLLKAAA